MDTPESPQAAPIAGPAARLEAGSPAGSLDGSGVLVTGGTSGIGAAIAELSLREGARVVVTGRDRERGQAVVRHLRELGAAWFVAADATDPRAVDESVEAAVGRLGGLDALVNNAGIGLVAPLIDTPADVFDRLLAVNVRGPLLYAQAARAHLARRHGAIVNIASDAGLRGEQPIGAYSVSKAAVVMMSKMLALDLAPEVRCNCVCPGGTVPGMRHIGSLGDPEAGDDPSTWPLPPLGRLGKGADVAEAVVFFLSERSAFCSGATLLVDGGLQAGVAAPDRWR